MKKLHVTIIQHVLMFLILLLVFSSWIFDATPHYPLAKEGVLDLSNWDLKSEKKITLTGEWEFNWKQFLSDQDYQNGTPKNSIYVSVPQVWNRYVLDGKKLPGVGYATYHLKVIVPDTSNVLGIRINTMSSSYQFYIDNRLVAKNGTVSNSPKLQNRNFHR